MLARIKASISRIALDSAPGKTRPLARPAKALVSSTACSANFMPSRIARRSYSVARKLLKMRDRRQRIGRAERHLAAAFRPQMAIGQAEHIGLRRLTTGNHSCARKPPPPQENCRSGASSSGALLMKAVPIAGTRVAKPVPKREACARLTASRSSAARDGTCPGPWRAAIASRRPGGSTGSCRRLRDRRAASMPALAQLVGRTDARQQQQLRRVERAAGEDHLAVGMRLVLLAVLADIRCRPRAALEQNARRMRAGDERRYCRAPSPGADRRPRRSSAGRCRSCVARG